MWFCFYTSLTMCIILTSDNKKVPLNEMFRACNAYASIVRLTIEDYLGCFTSISIASSKHFILMHFFLSLVKIMHIVKDV